MDTQLADYIKSFDTKSLVAMTEQLDYATNYREITLKTADPERRKAIVAIRKAIRARYLNPQVRDEAHLEAVRYRMGYHRK